MKTVFVVLFSMFTSICVSAQFRSFGIVVGAGHTIVDVEKMFDRDLEEWDNIGIVLKATGEYSLQNGFSMGGEIGANRLYYWEYRWSDGTYSGTRYRSEWTTNLLVHGTKYFGENFFVQAGPGVHIFNDGSGTVLGLMTATGYNLNIGENFQIPLGLRIEFVFGEGTPIPVMLATGFKYILK